MSEERGYSRVLDLFHRAVEIEEDERARWLRQACGEDRALREELESLLRHDLGTWDVGDSGVSGGVPVASVQRPSGTARTGGDRLAVPSNVPRTFGRYEVLHEIGRGGMAVVYLAEQLQPVRRRVALKVVKVGMDTRELIRRFESERQALALMSHPNIANVYDAGSTESGRPYFAMEHVDGVPITDYCDAFELSVEERLDLFCTVCAGVQHAHQKGIIHRDIKPSNVLVRVEDERPTVKIIDFGIAKAIAQPLIEGGMTTRLGHLVGTPAYMSPEQALPALRDIDTRADVYALGVLLYELLVGELPFDLPARGSGVEEIRRLVIEREPSRPSSRMASHAKAAEVAARRATHPAALVRRLAGDLDWILLRALEKDRTRRYPSASELAQDLRRHLDHEAVLASPPTAGYRLGKFVRRHRLGVAAGAIVLLSMVLGIAGATIGLVRAREEAQATRQTLDFVTDLFDELDPEKRRGDQLTALELLDRGAVQASRVDGTRPLVRARLLDTIGDLYVSLGSYEESLPLLEEALALRELELPEDHLDVATSKNGLSNVLFLLERYERAERLSREALAIQEAGLGRNHLKVALSLNNLGLILAGRGQLDDAEALVGRAVAILSDISPSDPEQIEMLGEAANALNSLGGIYLRQRLLSESEAAYAQALAIRSRILDPEHPDLATSLHNYGLLLLRSDRQADAVRHLERALRIRERVLGRDHVRVAASLSVLGEVLMELGELARSEEAHRRALAIRIATLGEDHGLVAQSLYNLSLSCARAGKAEEAEQLMRRSLATVERTSGLASATALVPLRALAEQLRRSGRDEEARDLLREAIESIELDPAPDPDLLRTLHDELRELSFERTPTVPVTNGTDILLARRGEENSR